MASKMPVERQTHLNREKKPPIKKVNIFLWDWSDEDPLQLVRTMVTRCEAEDIVSSYSDSHLVYNSYSNVWDTCEYFGEQSNDNDDIGTSSTLPKTPLTYILGYLAFHYGFVPPPSFAIKVSCGS